MTGYAKQRATWLDFPTTSTPITAANLNGLETAIFELKTRGAKDPMDYGAVVNGVTDDTAAWNSALSDAGTGGIVLAPPGTSVVGDLVVPSEFMTIRGAGSNKSFLKAKAAATYVLDITKLRDTTIADLTVHGNARASKGIRLRGGAATSGSERNALERVNVTQCSTGVDVVTAVIDQVDKNTFYRCWINDCTTGMSINSVDGQQNLLLQTHIEGCTSSMVLTNGSVEMYGGQLGQTGGTAILLNGTTIQWLLLQGVITEGAAICIDGNTNWPLNGVSLINSVIDGSTNTVKCGVANSVLYAENSRFLTGSINATASATNFCFEDAHSTFVTGATVSLAGANSVNRKRYFNPLQSVASATTITIPAGSQVVSITGTTTIDSIVATGWYGQTITLQFVTTPTVRHNVTNIFLNGAANFVATANDTLTLVCTGTNWYEVSRAVI